MDDETFDEFLQDACLKLHDLWTEAGGKSMGPFELQALNGERVVFKNVRAIRTGEFRCPKQGDWYLSGSIVEAYRAPNDLTTPFHIVRLVVAREETSWVIVPQQ